MTQHQENIALAATSPSNQENSISDIEYVAAAYVRVSTRKQANFGTSIDSQENSVRKFAESKGWTLHDSMIFKEEKSASSNVTSKKIKSIEDSGDIWTSRPRLKELIDAAINKKFKHLIIYSHDRFTRDFQEFLSLKLLFTKLGIKVYFSKPGEQVESRDDALNNFFEMMLSNLAELEANIIGSRVKLGEKTNVLNNHWPGGYPPFGYELEKIEQLRKTILIKDPVEVPIVEEVFKLYSIGYTLEEIVTYMQEHYPQIIPTHPKKKQKSWTKSAVAFIIQNEVYTGKLVWDRRGGVRNPGKHLVPIRAEKVKPENIIVQNWDEILNIRSKQSGKNARYFSTPFLLKDKLYCSKCGNIMKPKNNGKNKNSTYYCNSPTDDSSYKHPKSHLIVRKDIIENAVLMQLNEILQNKIQCCNKTLWQLYTDKINDTKVKLEQQINEIDNLLKENKRLQSNCESFIKDKDKFLLENNYEEYTDDFFKSIESYNTHLELNKIYLENMQKAAYEKKELKSMNEKAFNETISQLIKKLTDVNKTTSITQDEPDKSKLANRQKRMLIDKILDKVILIPTNKGLSLNIVLKLPHEKFQDFVLDTIPSIPTCPINY